MPRRPQPDLRPRWHQPNLPCIRNYKMADGTLWTEVSSEYERRYREFLMETSLQPDWKSDPTYDLRKPKR